MCFAALSDYKHGGGLRSIRSREEPRTARHEQAQGLAGGIMGAKVLRQSRSFFLFFVFMYCFVRFSSEALVSVCVCFFVGFFVHFSSEARVCLFRYLYSFVRYSSEACIM